MAHSVSIGRDHSRLRCTVSNPDTLTAAIDCNEFTQGSGPWTAGQDLVFNALTITDGQTGPCRTIQVVGVGGTLVVKLAGSGGNWRTLTVSQGDARAIQAIAISHTSTCGAVQVFW